MRYIPGAAFEDSSVKNAAARLLIIDQKVWTYYIFVSYEHKASALVSSFPALGNLGQYELVLNLIFNWQAFK